MGKLSKKTSVESVEVSIADVLQRNIDRFDQALEWARRNATTAEDVRLIGLMHAGLVTVQGLLKKSDLAGDMQTLFTIEGLAHKNGRSRVSQIEDFADEFSRSRDQLELFNDDDHRNRKLYDPAYKYKPTHKPSYNNIDS